MSARKRPQDSPAIWAKMQRLIVPEPMSGCWLWLGAVNNQGYPKAAASSSWRLGTRVALEVALGRTLGRWEFALHRCDVPSCVNPVHLYVGDSKQNSADMLRRDRQRIEQRRGVVMTRERASEARQLRANGWSLAALCAKYGMKSLGSMSLLLSGKRWRHGVS